MAGPGGTTAPWIGPSVGVCMVLCPLGLGLGGGGEIVLGGRAVRDFLRESLLDLSPKNFQANKEKLV